MDEFPQLAVDRSRAQSLADQLTAALRESILTGEMRSGDERPASRTLAKTLGLSRSVVVSAYERLVGEGYLESRQGAGTRVVGEIPDWGLERIDTAGPAREETDGSHVDAPMLRRGAKPRANSIPDPVPHDAEPSSAPINLLPGRPFTPPLPPREWVRALSRAARAPWRSDAPDPRGEYPLRRALAAHARRSRGIDCDPDDVYVTTGTSEALLVIALALRELHGTDATVAVEDPGYREGTQALSRGGARVIPLDVGHDGATAATVRVLARRQPLTALMLTPSHQFPLGGRIPAAERHALVAWASEAGAVIIEDDYDSEFRHEGAVLPAMASLDRAGRIVHVTTLNKILSPSIRCGAIVLGSGVEGRELRAAVEAVRADLGSTVPLMTQSALAEFLDGGGFRREIGRTRREYRHRRELLLAECLAQGLEVSGDAGGLHVRIALPTDVSGDEIVIALANRGVLVDRVEAYRIAESALGRDGILVSYGAETVPRLIRGIYEIADVIRG